MSPCRPQYPLHLGMQPSRWNAINDRMLRLIQLRFCTLQQHPPLHQRLYQHHRWNDTHSPLGIISLVMHIRLQKLPPLCHDPYQQHKNQHRVLQHLRSRYCQLHCAAKLIQSPVRPPHQSQSGPHTRQVQLRVTGCSLANPPAARKRQSRTKKISSPVSRVRHLLKKNLLLCPRYPNAAHSSTLVTAVSHAQGMIATSKVQKHRNEIFCLEAFVTAALCGT